MLKKGLRKPQQRLLDSYFKENITTNDPTDIIFNYYMLSKPLIDKLEKIYFYGYLCKDVEKYLEDLAYKAKNEKLHKELQKLFTKA
jgi:hypothetical protein